MSELGVGYISIVPEVSKITPGISKALGDAEATATPHGKSMGSKLATGLSRSLKVGAASAGVAAGGAIATALTKGMGRLTAIENAESKLKGLGNSAEDVTKIMENANAAVKGTAYGLDAAATTAAMVVASGIKPGQELEQVLKTVADTAGIAGDSMDAMGAIFGSVAARGKLQGDDLMQLTSRGIPVLQLLGDELGKTAAEVSDMVSKGEIDFATFEKAMRAGVGGAAVEAGNTFQGALANMGAAAGRVGATALSPFFDLVKDGFGSTTNAIDAFHEKIKPLASQLGTFLQGTVVPAVRDAKTQLEQFAASTTVQQRLAITRNAFLQVVEAGKQLAPVVVNIATTVGQVGTRLGVATWNAFVATLETAANVVQALSGPLEAVTGFLKDHPNLVTAAVAAWGGFKIVPSVLGAITPSLVSVKEQAIAGGKGISIFGSAFVEAMGYAQKANPELSRAGAALRVLGGQGGVAAVGLEKARGAIGGIVSALGGPWGLAITGAAAVVTTLVNAHQNAKAAAESYSTAMATASSVNADFTAAVAGTTGALSEQAQKLAADVVDVQLSGLKALDQHMQGWAATVPAPDTTEFTARLDEMARETAMSSAWGAAAAQGEYEKLARGANKALGEMESYLESAGLSVQDLGAIVAAGGPEFENLVAHMHGLGQGGQLVADELEAARAKLLEIEQAARNLDPAAVQAARGIDVLADSASSGADRLEALESVMQAMGLAPKDAEEAMMDAAAAVDHIVESVTNANMPLEELGANLFDASGKLDPANESARLLSSTLSDMRGELLNVAANGGDVGETFQRMQPALAAIGDAYKLNKDEVDALAESFGLLPDVVSTLVHVNSEGVGGDLAKVWSAIYSLDEGATITIDAVDKKAQDVLTALGYKWESVADGTQMVITADDKQALEALQTVTDRFNEVGGKVAEPKILLDNSQLKMSTDEAMSIIATLDVQNPSPQAQLILDEFKASGEIAQGDLAYLTSLSARPTADLDRELLDAGVKISRDELGKLQELKTEPRISVDNSAARTGIDQVKGWLSSIKDKTIRLFTRREGNAADGLLNIGSRRFMADGGKLSKQDAQIARGGQWITWAEDETQGESFIPHALSKRRRSTQILAETARIFGLELFDRSGNAIRRDGSSVEPTSRSFMADGGVSASQLLKFAEGKEVNGHKAARSLQGAPYDWGGVNWGDCSGAMSALARFATGLAPFAGRFATGSQAGALSAMGFANGLGSGARLAIGWFNGGPYGGHTSGTIHFGDGKSVNVEMGGGAGGQGKIGGAAAGADHAQYTDHAHVPLDGSLSLSLEDVDSTSVDGIRVGSKTVSWGQAQSLFDQAKYYQRTGLLRDIPSFDIGGRWPSGVLGRNQSNADELVLTNEQWKHQSKIAAMLPTVGAQFIQVASLLKEATTAGEKQVKETGHGFGGDFLGNTALVRDAEQGLLETRQNIVAQAEAIGEAEEAVAEAREKLTKAEAQGAGLTTAQRRKLADAEENLAKARRSGKPDKIADAEKRLARAREDVDEQLAKSGEKNAQQVRQAQKNLNKAEDKLHKTRLEHAETLADLEAAERAAVAARFQAASDLSISIGASIGRSFQAVSGLFDEMGRLAGIVDQTRQAVSKLQMQQESSALRLMQSYAQAQLAARDVDRVRADGVISVARAEYELEMARQNAQRVGMTSIEALSGAMDRFYRTGEFSLDMLTQEQIENSAEVQHAWWGVQVAQKQNALDMLEAERAKEIAQLRVAQATLEQLKIAQLLEVQTKALKQQAAELYGMTQNQAKGAARGFGGVGKVGSGIGKAIGAFFAGVGGFLVGGPVGAIMAAAPLVASGAKDIAQGAIDIRDNTEEMSEAWKKMNSGEKAAVVLGTGGTIASTAIGGAVGGAQGAQAGAQVGATITEATIGSLQYSIESKIEKSQRQTEDKLSAIERDFAHREHELNQKALREELEYIYAKDRAESDLRWAKMMQESVTAPTDKLREAYEAAAKTAAERADRHHRQSLDVAEDTNRLIESQLGVMRELPGMLDRLGNAVREANRAPVSGVEYANRA